MLIESLDDLDEKYSVYIREHYYEGMAYEEIAEKHGITKEVAKKRVYRSVDKLRKIFYAKGGTK